MEKIGEEKKLYFLNVAAQGSGRILSVFAVMGAYVLGARFLPMEVFGKYTYILTFLGILGAVADIGMTPTLSRDIAQAGPAAPSYWGNYLTLRLLAHLAAFALGALAAFFLRPDLFPYLAAGCLCILFINSRFFEPVYQVYKKPFYSFYASSLYALAYVAFTLSGLYLFASLSAMIGAYLLANIVYSLLAFYLSCRILRPEFRIKWDLLRQILFVSAPLGAASLITIINSRIDIVLLSQMRSDAEVGIYGAAYRFLDLAVTAAVVVMAPIAPFISKFFLTDKPRVMSVFTRMIEWLTILTIPMAILTPYFSKPLLEWLYGERFGASAAPLNVLAWAAVLVFFSLASSSLCLAMRGMALALWSTLVACAANISLNLWLIPKHGVMAAAWVTVISELIMTGLCFMFIFTRSGHNFRLRSWYLVLAANVLLYLILRMGLFEALGPSRVILCVVIYALTVVVIYKMTGEKMLPSAALLSKIRK